MRHTYDLLFAPTRHHPKRAIKSLVERFRATGLDDTGEAVSSNDGELMRALFAVAKQSGFTCSLSVSTQYDYEDALIGELGVFDFCADTDANGTLPKYAFDLTAGCPSCGLTAVQVKPHVLSESAIRYMGNFLDGHRGASRVLIRAEIGRKIVEVTGQPWCMRHPVTRTGRIVEEWMEPVPCATMPALSPKSEGIIWGATWANSCIGEPPEVVPPCPVCGRSAWAQSNERPVRLVYSRAAINAAQQHAVLSMYEPKDGFPDFNPIQRTFKQLYGLPWLVFNRAAIQVLMTYMQTEHVRTMSYIQPVFAE